MASVAARRCELDGRARGAGGEEPERQDRRLLRRRFDHPHGGAPSTIRHCSRTGRRTSSGGTPQTSGGAPTKRRTSCGAWRMARPRASTRKSSSSSPARITSPRPVTARGISPTSHAASRYRRFAAAEVARGDDCAHRHLSAKRRHGASSPAICWRQCEPLCAVADGHRVRFSRRERSGSRTRRAHLVGGNDERGRSASNRRRLSGVGRRAEANLH